MSRLCLRIGILLFPSLVLGQTSYNSITVTSPTTASPAQPDQTTVVVSVTATADQTLDQIVAALPGTGITAASLVGISGPSTAIFTSSGPVTTQPTTTLIWNFQLSVPVAKAKDTVAALVSLEKTLAQNKSGLSFTFYQSGATSSPAQAAGCSLSGLMADALAQAQTIAGAAGLNVGAVLGVNGASSDGAPACLLTVRFAVGPQFGQTTPNVITVSATRSLRAQPDQVQISLTVASPLDTTQDQVVTALSQAGITGVTPGGVNSTVNGYPQQAQTLLQWGFTITPPVSKVSAAIAQLTAAQQNIGKNNSGLTLSYYVEGLQTSADAQKALTCAQNDLITDAKSTAQQVAAAASVHAGAIVSVASGSGAVSQYATPVFVAAARLGAYVSPGVSSTTCALTIQFQLLP